MTMTADEARAFLTQFDGYPPTEDQLEVIRAPLDPALVIAGAGSGKTKTMALRVVYQVATGAVDPEHVLGLTFTKKAANELSSRINRMLRRAAQAGHAMFDENSLLMSRPLVQTYNSFASSIASDYGLLVGLDPSARLINDGERYQIMSAIVRSWPTLLHGKTSTLIDHALAISGRILDNQITTDDVRRELRAIEEHFASMDLARSWYVTKALDTFDQRRDVLDLVDAYLEYKRTHQLTEFADQVATANRVLTARPEFADQVRDQHRLILLDEFQDTSVNQLDFLATLFTDTAVVAVGDPNQAIYGWRGASASALSDFRNRFKTGGPTPQFTLSTAFRNRSAILDVANAVAEPLRSHALREGLDVPPLEAASTGGSVELLFPDYAAQSYDAVAADIETYIRENADANEGRGPTVAVLCRQRSAFTPMAEALEARGIDYVQVGNTSAISAPECVTVRALLRLSAQPDRGDALARLLTYLNVGAADVAALGEYAGHHSIPEVLGDSDVGMSEQGTQRLSRIRSWIDRLTEARYARLPDLVNLAIREANLDVEVAAQSVRGGIGRSALAALARTAATFADSIEGATLTDFLDWLDEVEEREKNGDDDLPLADLLVAAEGRSEEEMETPSRVTIMTVHGAKGLEWDYVAIPELRKGRFDLTSTAKTYWLKDASEIPFSLRADRASLPEWSWEQVGDPKAAKETYDTWRTDRMVIHENREVRRLAYVAMTRPKDRLVLAGYWYDNVDNAEKIAADPDGRLAKNRGPATLLSGLPIEVPTGWPVPDLSVTERERRYAWPTDLGRGTTEETRAAARALADAEPADENAPVWIRQLLEDVDALSARTGQRFQLDYLSAGQVVGLASDEEAFVRDSVRPIPEVSGAAARLGQHVHEYIARHFGLARTVDLLGEDHQVLGLDVSKPHVEKLISRFLDTTYATLRPTAIEQPINVPIAGYQLRGTIDAIFTDGDHVHIVDWKTGRAPIGEDAEAKHLQLHLYRYAWATVTGTDPDLITATFIYLGEDDEKRRIVQLPMLSLTEISERVAGLLRHAGL